MVLSPVVALSRFEGAFAIPSERRSPSELLHLRLVIGLQDGSWHSSPGDPSGPERRLRHHRCDPGQRRKILLLPDDDAAHSITQAFAPGFRAG